MQKVRITNTPGLLLAVQLWPRPLRRDAGVVPSGGGGSAADSLRSPPSLYHFLQSREGGRCNLPESCCHQTQHDIADHMTTRYATEADVHCRSGELPVAQVRPDDAGQEVDGLVEARRRQTAPRRHSGKRVAGGGATDGGVLRRGDTG